MSEAEDERPDTEEEFAKDVVSLSDALDRITRHESSLLVCWACTIVIDNLCRAGGQELTQHVRTFRDWIESGDA